MNNKEKVLKFLLGQDKAFKTGEIAKELGLDSKEVSKIIKELKNEGKVYSPKRCYYTAKK